MRDLYLALGDSITAGIGASHLTQAFVGRIATAVGESNLATKTLVVAQNGWTTKDVLNAATLVAHDAWQRVNLVTLMTGGNDLRKLLRRQYLPISGAGITPLMVYRRLQIFAFHMEQLCRFISHQQVPNVFVVNVYNPVPQSPLAVSAIEGLNTVTKEIAHQYDFQLVDVYSHFHNNEVYFIDRYRTGRMDDLISPFGRPIHPNNLGHKEIADVIIKQLLSINQPTRMKPAKRQSNRVMDRRRSL